MSITAPTQFAITGDATATYSITWNGSPAAATIVVNSNTYPLSAFFDNPTKLQEDLAVSASLPLGGQALYRLFAELQNIVFMYFLQLNQSLAARFSIAIS